MNEPNDPNDPETRERLQQALSKAKEARLAMERKEEAKRWADIPFPLRLEDALARLSKEELSELRKRLNVKHASHLNKQELIAELGRTAPDAVRRLWPLLDQERFDLLKKIAGHGGVMPAPDMESDKLDYWRTRGIVFTGAVRGKRMLVMPQEMLKVFGRIDEHALTPIVHRNTEWILLAQGMLYYYGTLRMNEFESLLEKYTGEQIKTIDCFDVIAEAIDYYKEIRLDENGYSNRRVWDPANVKREQERRLGLGYYPFSKKQLLAAGKPGYVDRGPAYREVMTFLLNHYDMNRLEADLIAQECEYAARIGESPKDIVQFLLTRIEIGSRELLQDAMSRLTRLINETRQWFLKGHTPQELFQKEEKFVKPLTEEHKADVIDMSTRKKIGRNDPCPCGSGKKFKKCCGG